MSDPSRAFTGWSFLQGALQFCDLVNDLQSRSRDVAPSELIQQVMEKSGYVSELIADGNDEAEERRRNLQELVNAALQYQEENEEGDLEGFLATAALSSDADNKDTASDRVTLMTLHSSKGWSSPGVFAGLEQGLFPATAPWMILLPGGGASALLCGHNTGKERLFLSHACERRLWGGMREAAVLGVFASCQRR